MKEAAGDYENKFNNVIDLKRVKKEMPVNNNPETKTFMGAQIEYIPQSRSPWFNISHRDAFRMAPHAYDLYLDNEHIRLHNFLEHAKVHNIRSLTWLRLIMELDEEKNDLHGVVNVITNDFLSLCGKIEMHQSDLVRLKLLFDLAEEIKIYNPKEVLPTNEYSFQSLETLLTLLLKTPEKSEKAEILLCLIREKIKNY